jgi:glucose/arabinose dehydrogenase
MTKRHVRATTTLALLTTCAIGSAALAGGTPLTTERFAFGFTRPVLITHAPGDTERLFVLEKQGRVRVIINGTVQPQPFLDVNPLVGGGTSNNDERGLLGMAFHPDYQNNGFFYLNYTANGGATTIRRYSVAQIPNLADPNSGVTVMVIGQPQANHNGGWIEFGPNDGYLYISMGDGGGANDTGGGHTPGTGNAQDITNNLLGKMLRIDVDNDDFPADPNRNYAIPPDNPFVGTTGDDEIWAYGLRNAWRNSFDPTNGDLYTADVGQNAWEEINVQPGDSTGGENYGWRCLEGDSCTGLGGCDCNDPTLIDPILTYSHAFGCSLTGGEVYRGCAIPTLNGTYFYADFCSNRIWSIRYDGNTVSEFQERTAELVPGGGLFINSIVSFGRDALGELYIVDQGGEIFKILADAPPTNDCNDNNVEDACDIAGGETTDLDGDGIPDVCQSLRIVQAQGQPNQTRPHTGYIDPRVESSDGVALDRGISQFQIQFSEEVRNIGGAPLSADAFTLRETGLGGHDSPNAIASIDATNNPLVIVTLDRVISLNEWTTLEAAVESLDGTPIENLGDLGPGQTEPDRVDIGFLPADVNQSSNVTPFDLLQFRMIVNGTAVITQGTDEDFVDSDRSGAVTPFDLLAFRQLVNGVSPPATQPWSGAAFNNAQP